MGLSVKYKSKEEAQQDHVKNYRSDGIKKGKGQRYSADYHRVGYCVDQIKDGAYTLEVGCNSGIIAVSLMLNKNCYVKAIDIVPELVEKAKKHGVFAKVGEAEDLSRFKDNEFDYVTCSEVLEHLYDPLPAIKEAYRVLKPGGLYIVTVPHPSSFMVNDPKKKADYHQQDFTMEILDTIFHCVFKRNKVFFSEIPYVKEYCLANKLDVSRPQWIGLTCRK